MRPRLPEGCKYLRLGLNPQMDELRARDGEMDPPLIEAIRFPAFNPWWEPIIKLWRSDSEGTTYHLTAQPWMGRVPFEHPLWYEQERVLEPFQVEKLLLLVSKSTLVSPKHPTKSGLDGTGYEVAIHQGATSVCFSWWCEAPKPWEPVQLLAETLLRLVDKEVIAIEEAFYREGRTAPQVMSSLLANLEVMDTLNTKLGRDHSSFAILSERFSSYPPGARKELARGSRILFNPFYGLEEVFIKDLSPDLAWLEEYRMACQKLNHSLLEVQLVDFE